MKLCKSCINYVPGYIFPCSEYLNRYSDFLKSEKCSDFVEKEELTTLIKQSNSDYWKKCKKCGEEYIYKEHNFCPNCGRKIIR